jgi:hypothetical protein
MSTTAAGSSQNGGGASSTQTNESAPHQSPPRAPSPVQVIQGDVEFDQIQIQDWDEEVDEDEAAAEEKELIWVHQKIERLRHEQETIMRRQAAAQRAEAHRQHINKEWARLVELQYTIDIHRQQEERQEPTLDQRQHQPNANPHPPTFATQPHPSSPASIRFLVELGKIVCSVKIGCSSF